MKNNAVIAICIWLLALAFPASAARLSGGYTIGALSFSCRVQGQGNALLTQNSTGCTDVLRSGAFQVSGSGAATYDTLRASAGISFSEADPSGFVGEGSVLGSADGTARFDDRVTIDIPGRSGDIVELVFETALDGTLSASADNGTYAQSEASLRVNVNGFGVTVSRNAKSRGDSNSNDFNPGRVQIELGSAFSVLGQLSVEARLQRDIPSAGVQLFSGNALADFSGSGGITSFSLFELGEGGALIQEWDLTSESGEFGFYTAVIPLPGAAWLFISGLLTLVYRRRPPRTRP